MKTIKSLLTTKISVGFVILIAILATIGDYAGHAAYKAYDEWAKNQVLEMMAQPNVVGVKFKGFSFKEITYLVEGETRLITVDGNGNIIKDIDY